MYFYQEEAQVGKVFIEAVFYHVLFFFNVFFLNIFRCIYKDGRKSKWGDLFTFDTSITP